MEDRFLDTADSEAAERRNGQDVASEDGYRQDPAGQRVTGQRVTGHVVQSLLAAADERKRALRGSWDDSGAGTEVLRNALRNYRVFIDRLSRA